LSLEQLIMWFPVLVILSYLPHLIWLDLKYREIPYPEWYGLLPMFIVTGYLYAVGFYPIECMWISFAAVGVFYAAMKLHMFEGADFMLLMFIGLFFVVNPLSGRVLMPLVLIEMLLIAFLFVNLVALIFQKKVEQFPMIPVIAAAFVMAVVLG
jgi:hypothetical protein